MDQILNIIIIVCVIILMIPSVLFMISICYSIKEYFSLYKKDIPLERRQLLIDAQYSREYDINMNVIYARDDLGEYFREYGENYSIIKFRGHDGHNVEIHYDENNNEVLYWDSTIGYREMKGYNEWERLSTYQNSDGVVIEIFSDPGKDGFPDYWNIYVQTKLYDKVKIINTLKMINDIKYNRTTGKIKYI